MKRSLVDCDEDDHVMCRSPFVVTIVATKTEKTTKRPGPLDVSCPRVVYTTLLVH